MIIMLPCMKSTNSCLNVDTASNTKPPIPTLVLFCFAKHDI